MKASLPFKYITAVKNGKYYVIFDFKDENGKRKRKWVKTDLPEKCSKKALNAKVDEIAEEFRKAFGGNTDTSSNTSANNSADASNANRELDNFFSVWLIAIKPNVARTTHQCYSRISKRFLNYINEKYPHITLGEIIYTHIQEFLNYKLDQGIKGSSAKQYYLTLHSAFAYAVKMDMLLIHPMDKLTVPRAERHEATFYNVDELNSLFNVFENDKLELIVHIAAYYGLRRCEILGLRWDAIDFKNKTLTVQRKIVSDYDENGEAKLFVENRLKTNSTRRTLPLIPHIEKMLLEKKKTEEHCRKICGKSFDTEFDGFICRDNLGCMISPNYVTQHFHYIINRNGMKHLRFHDLRHSCAGLLLANDIPMKAIQEWLGHSNFSITANLYSHLEYNAKVTSAETIARVLGGENGKKSDNIKMKNDPPVDTGESFVSRL